MKESDLVRFCLDYLASKRIFHWRNNTGAYKPEHGGFIKFGAKGSPDIFAVRDGRLIGIECKVGKNKQSSEQKKWEHEMVKHGCLYWLIMSPEEMIGKLV